jgi:hypothetical protein
MSSRLAPTALLLIASLGTALDVGMAPSEALAAPAQGKAKAKAKPAKDPADDKAGATAPLPADGGALPADKTGGQDVEMTEDAAPTDMDGTNENPDAPLEFDAPPPPVPAAVVARVKGYPLEEVRRPITLPRFMTEVALDLRNTFSPFVNGNALRARFGINRKAQIGLTYNIGGLYDDGRGKTSFNTGKAVGINGTYAIKEWIAAQVSVPMYLEPFAASVTLGAPMKVQINEQYAIVAGEDIIDIRLSKFVPSLSNEAANEVNVGYVNTNTRTDKGNFRFSGAGIFQYKKNLAFTGRIAITLIDFATLDIGYLLKVGGQLTVRKSLDLSATLGVDDLEEAKRTFGLSLAAAFRI